MKLFKLFLIWGLIILAVSTFSHAEVLTETLDDGSKIQLYYDPEVLKSNKVTDDYAHRALKAAARAYYLLVKDCGFSTDGYSFASPDKSYAYDPDQTIDIFIGDPSSTKTFYGYTGEDFKTAYFDPCDVEEKPCAHEAIILFPARLDILRERAVSTSHSDTEDDVIFGTMAHEMTHLINYYYNKNLKGVSASRGTDWFVEGLARYMETRAGSWDSFYSRGYVRKVPKGYAYLEEGVNYFMKHPNRPLEEMAYDYAIFWSYFDDRYGMKTIELLAREFRNLKGGNAYMKDLQGKFESVTGATMEEILAGFAYHIYEKSLDPKTRDNRLDQIKHSSIWFDGRRFSLQSGERKGKAARIYNAKGTNPWATEVHKITFSSVKTPILKFINKGKGDLIVQLINLEGKDFDEATISSVVGKGRSLKISKRAETKLVDGSGFYILVTNLSFCQKAAYEITAFDRFAAKE